jgi:hypothetical protein
MVRHCFQEREGDTMFLLIIEESYGASPSETSQEDFDTLEEAQQAVRVERARFETGPYYGSAEVSLCVVLDGYDWVCEGKKRG